MTDMKPKDAIKWDIVQLDTSEEYPKKEVLREDVLYRYLYQPGEQQIDQRSHATDFGGSKNTYRLDNLVLH